MDQELRSTNGIETDIGWIKRSLERIEKKVDCLEKKTVDLLIWKAKVIGVSIGGSAVISFIVSILIKIFR